MTAQKPPADDLSDEALLILFANGDPFAATQLSERLVPNALRLACTMLNDQPEAEDVVQEAMLRLWRIAPDWQPEKAKPATWLYRVVHNLCIDRTRIRSKQIVGTEGLPEPQDPARPIEDKLIEDEQLDALRAALASLPQRQRQAVILRHIEQLSNPDIAEIMDVSVEAVESLTARGKRGLAQLLHTSLKGASK